MRRIFLFITLILLISTPVYSQSWVEQWDKTAGGTEEDIIGTFQMTADSGFIMFGTSFSRISGTKTGDNQDTSSVTSDYWMVRTDGSGNILWDKSYGGNLTEILFDGIITSDGGYLMGGQSFSDSSGDKTASNWDPTLLSSDLWLVKTDNSGNLLWEKRYGGTTYESFGAVLQTVDGGYLVGCSSFSGAGGNKTDASQGAWDYWLLKLNASGDKIWDKRFGGSNDDYFYTIAAGSDGNFLLAGYSNSESSGDKSEPNRGNYDYWIIKIDDAGNKIWDKTFGGDSNDWLFAICAGPDSGYMIGGQSYSGSTGDKSIPNHDTTASGSDRWVISIDSNGNKLWDQVYGGEGTDDLSRIVPMQDGGYLLSGESYAGMSGNKTEANLGPEQTWVIKIDSAGLFLWDKTLFTDGHDESGSALPIGANCFVSVNFSQGDTGGYKTEIGYGYGDYWMIKVCNDSLLSVKEPLDENNWSVAPNPFTNEITLMAGEAFSDVSIQLTDITGRIIRNWNSVSGDGKFIFNGAELPQGIYIFLISDSKKIYHRQVIKTD